MRLVTLAAVCAATLLAAAPALAQPRADSAYAESGFAIIKLQPSAVATDVAFTADGGTVHVGRLGDARGGSFIARLAADGTPVESFGTNGVVEVRKLPGSLLAPRLTAVAMLADGRIVVGGGRPRTAAPDAPLDAFVAAFTPGGDLDTLFAGDGIVGLGPYADAKSVSVTDLAVAPDGGVVAVAVDMGAGRARSFAARLSSSGALDTTFGQFGYVTASGSRFDAVAVRPDGRIVVAGSLERPTYTDWLVRGLTASGQPDLAFAGDGTLFGNVFGESSDALRSALVLDDGSLVLAGTTAKAHDGPVALGTTIIRVTPEGAPDLSFGYQGAVWTDVIPSTAGSGAERPGTPFVTDDGFGVVVGGDRHAGLTVLTVFADGAPDTRTDLFADRAGLTFFGAVERDGLVVATGGQTDAAGRSEPFSARIVVKAPGGTTAVEGAPSATAALAVAPNPTAAAARVTLTLDVPGAVTVRVVDALGRTVATLADRALPAGPTTLGLNAARLAPGVYAVVAETSAGRTVTRVTVLR